VGCIKPAAFECAMDQECEHAGVAGTCEPTRSCSFPDTTCSSGKRYGALAGGYSNQCVGADWELDAGISDGHVVDASIDAPPDAPSCPASYTTLPGAGNNRYRVVVEPAPWANQRATCRADSSRVQLAVPDNAAELQAISTFAGADAWIGISDAQLEGSYVTYNMPATFLPWAANEPDNNGNQDCVRALAGGTTIETQLCATASVAVCECVP
jgi:hypothetical protein